MIGLYQQEGIFYQLINNGLRTVSQEKASWEVLSLPFSHLYNAIKTLSKEAIRRELQSDEERDKLYTKDFTVYRGGRIRRS